MKKDFFKTIAISTVCILGLGAQAAPPTNSPYYTDLQFSYNKDSSAEALSIISVVSCYVRNMAPEIGFNAVGSKPYVAMVDANKCESDQPATTSSGLTIQAKRYETALIEASVSQAGVLSAKIWMTGKDEDSTVFRTWISARISGGAAKAPPFGDWEVNWCDDYNAITKTCPSLGHARVDSSGVRAYHYYSELGKEEESAVIGNVSADQQSGGGKFSRIDKLNNETQENVQGHYGFQPGLMFAKINTTEQCLIPRSDAPNARSSSWETWLYDSQTGARFDRNSGFNIKDADGNWGFAGNWGVSIGNRSASNGEVFTRVNSAGGNANTYTAMVTKGKLQKIQVQNTNLSAISGLTLRGNGPKSLVIDNASSSEWVSYYFNWNATTQEFVFTAYQDCPSTGCGSTQNLLTPKRHTIASLVAINQSNLWVYQEGTSNNYNIVLSESVFVNNNWSQVLYNPGTVQVRTRKEVTVYPGDTTVPSELICVGICVEENMTRKPYGPVEIADVSKYIYSWSANDGSLKVGANNIDFTSTDAMPFYSGALVSRNDLEKLKCIFGSIEKYCEEKADTQLATYYRWQSGPNSWERFIGLKNANGEMVKFEQPISVTYNVPPEDSSSYSGKQVTIQYPGSGNLWVPGYCFNPITNRRAKCDSSTQWANEFNIPFDRQLGFVTAISDDPAINGKTYLVKTLRRGVYFPRTTLSNCNELKPVANANESKVLPTRSDWKNPADPDSPTFIGAWQEPIGVPLIIDGKLQN